MSLNGGRNRIAYSTGTLSTYDKVRISILGLMVLGILGTIGTLVYLGIRSLL